MLTFDEAKNIGLNQCVEILGRDFVKIHAETSSTAYGKYDNCNVFCFVGVDDTPQKNTNDSALLLTSFNDKFPYRVSCKVSRRTGKCDILEQIIPLYFL